MSKVTAVIIAKNEEEMIEGCLQSLSFCDAIVVIDNNSTDDTALIARKKGAKVVPADTKDFSELRKIGIEKVKTTYIFYVDADERVSTELAQEILHVIAGNNSSIGCYRINRQNYYLGKNPWPKIEQLERLFRTKMLRGWNGKLHETPEYSGDTQDLVNLLLHYTHRNLSTMLVKTNEWSEIEAQNRVKAEHPPIYWWRFPRVMLQAFLNSYVQQQGFKAGTMGLIESTYQAFSIFVTYAKLWEQQEKSKKS